MFRREFKNYNVNCKNVVRKEYETRGRASGGLLQLSCKDIKMDLVPVSVTSYRIQAQKMLMGSKLILWINAYFPVDDGNITDELVAILTELERILNNSGANKVILGGDINFDMPRISKFAIKNNR